MNALQRPEIRRKMVSCLRDMLVILESGQNPFCSSKLEEFGAALAKLAGDRGPNYDPIGDIMHGYHRQRDSNARPEVGLEPGVRVQPVGDNPY
jgi:hypothetical protein